jgi:hypothetical protein
MSRSPVVIDPRNFDEGRDAGALRRTRRAADAYARDGKYDAAADAVFQTDPQTSERYRERGTETAEREYQQRVAPMVATEDYSGAIREAGQAGRPTSEITALRTQLRTANEEQLNQANRAVEQQARSLLGIAELEAAEQQAAYTQWRASLPEGSRANVPEAFSIGFVRRRLREAQTIAQYVSEEARERGFELQRERMNETQRHNRAMESRPTAATRRRPYTEFSATSAGYFDRAAAAHETILSLPNINWDEVWSTGIFGGETRDVNETTRRARQAMREFINVRNRRESGAAVSNAEWTSARMELFPVPGDRAESIAQKAAARERFIRGLVSSSQGAAQEFYPDRFADGSPYANMARDGDNVDYSDDGDAGGGEPPTITTQEEYNALPSGAEYYDSQGNYAVKP